MRFSCLILTLWLICSGCFSRFVMTPKELKEYYRDRPAPVFFTIQNDSVKLYCATTGADTLPPLLLIHGAPGAWYGSRNMLEDSLLQSRFHIIAVDRPGYGRSRFNGKRKAVPSIDIQSAAIHEALRLNRSFHKAVIVGSSYGAPIAAKMAYDYPQEFSRLILLAPAIDPEHEKFWWFHPYIRHGPIRWLLPRFINHATDEKFAHAGELRRLLPVWDRLRLPVVVVQGSEDHIVDTSNLNFARRHIRSAGSEFIRVPGAGHLIRWQQAGLVREILLGDSTAAKY